MHYEVIQSYLVIWWNTYIFYRSAAQFGVSFKNINTSRQLIDQDNLTINFNLTLNSIDSGIGVGQMARYQCNVYFLSYMKMILISIRYEGGSLYEWNHLYVIPFYGRFLNICNRSRKLRTLKMNCNNILLLTFYLKVPAKFIIRHYLKLKY